MLSLNNDKLLIDSYKMLASLTQKKPNAGQNHRPTSGFAFYSPFEGMTKDLEVLMKPMAKLGHRQQHLV
jgi:hypothetical protein